MNWVNFIFQNERITAALDKMPWYLLPLEKQKDIAHLMHRTQNGAVLTIGPFSALNYEAATDVWKLFWNHIDLQLYFWWDFLFSVDFAHLSYRHDLHEICWLILSHELNNIKSCFGMYGKNHFILHWITLFALFFYWNKYILTCHLAQTVAFSVCFFSFFYHSLIIDTQYSFLVAWFSEILWIP